MTFSLSSYILRACSCQVVAAIEDLGQPRAGHEILLLGLGESSFTNHFHCYGVREDDVLISWIRVCSLLAVLCYFTGAEETLLHI